MTPSNQPLWALKHKKPGTELRFINGKYYLYEYKTIYDKIKKRPRKISGSILGSVTQREGFIPSPKRVLKTTQIQDTFEGIRCKEFGVASLIASVFTLYTKSLERAFGEDWKNIVAIAYCRFVYRCPLKSIPFRLASSFLPEQMGLGAFSEKQASAILNRIGGQPDKRSQYMKSFIKNDDYILLDVTNVLSQSEQIPLAKKGYSRSLNFETQFNLMYVYSADSKMPVYYKLLPGNIREVKAFKNTLLEAGLNKAVIVADKGFYSKDNVILLQKGELNFVLPLRRDNKLINYSAIHTNTFKEGGNFFQYAKRPIWFKKYAMKEKLSLHLFLDEQLRVQEESDYLVRIKTHPENHSVADYHKRKNRFGTIAIITNLEDDEEEIYLTYKSRMAIEIMFDGMKNILNADHTYMQDEQTLQGWMFINHLTLQWYQHLYIELKEKGLLKQISVNDYIQLLTDVKKVKINDKWYLNEFTNQTKKLIDKLKIKWI